MRLQQRVKGLQQLKGKIRHLSERVRYTSAPMETLLGEVCSIPEDANTSDESRKEWERRLLCWGEGIGLSADDCAVLQGFINGLGRSDVEGEIRFCEEYYALIDERLQEAQEQLKTKGRVYPMLGVGCGVLTAILLW